MSSNASALLKRSLFLFVLLGLQACESPEADDSESNALSNGILVFQSDFGVSDGAVAAMKGVALGIDRDLVIEDLTHEIPAYDIWSATHRLSQSAEYWPAGTVFVSVVDPGVGTARQSVVLLTKSGHLFVSPDNGTLSEVANILEVKDLRLIDHDQFEAGGLNTNTFHGRDVYARVGALLASGTWSSMNDVGNVDSTGVEMLKISAPKELSKGAEGMIEMLDVQYGNVWTNIPESIINDLGINYSDMVNVEIVEGGQSVLKMSLPYTSTFGDLPPGDPLLYINSLGNLSLALNQGDFADKYGIGFGPEWSFKLSLVP